MIDVFPKFMAVVPVKIKSAGDVASAFFECSDWGFYQFPEIYSKLFEANNLFVCQLLGYVFRTVRPSVSWISQTNSENKLASVIEWVKDEKTIPEPNHRRCTRKKKAPGAEHPLDAIYLWQERTSEMKNDSTNDIGINNKIARSE